MTTHTLPRDFACIALGLSTLILSAAALLHAANTPRWQWKPDTRIMLNTATGEIRLLIDKQSDSKYGFVIVDVPRQDE